ncbi:phosphate-starvation-inducible PsiE family protein [Ferroglobus sp.]|uniref:phosphate-starvation-inducible PsiE family protein n=1 Tax=Ferroglobus sp. TaxID=2614230 RepID=UPI0025C692DF|nr:phosphate-starvation-inducible PsiE family protein [Ferroglobus sp.]
MRTKGYKLLNILYESLVFAMSVIVLLLLIGYIYWILTQIYTLIQTGSKEVFDKIVIEILTFLVLIELVRIFTEYLEFRRVRLYLMAELAAIFILREMFIILYTKEFDWLSLIAFSVLILSVTAARTLAIMYSPQRR